MNTAASPSVHRPAPETADAATAVGSAPTAPVNPAVATLTALHAFVDAIAPDTKYHELPELMRKGGWIWQLREREVRSPTESLFMFTFDFWIGKSVDTLVLLDRVTTLIPINAGSQISLLARMSLEQTLIYLVTGRLPPPPPAVPPQPAPAPRAKREVEIEDEDFHLPDLEPAPETEPAQAPVRPAPTPRAQLDVVYKVEPDGVPLIVDPYELGAPAEDVVDAILTLVEDTLPKIQSLEALQAFWTKNDKEFAFIGDLGTAADKARLPALFKNRQTQLGTMAPDSATEPRRRRAR